MRTHVLLAAASLPFLGPIDPNPYTLKSQALKPQRSTPRPIAVTADGAVDSASRLPHMLLLLGDVNPTPTLPYPTLPYPTLPYPTLPYPTLLYTTLLYPTLTFPTLPCPTLPYPTLPYPVLPWGRIAKVGFQGTPVV